MDQEISGDFNELEMLRAKVFYLERTINKMAFKSAQTVSSHKKAIARMQKHVKGKSFVLDQFNFYPISRVISVLKSSKQGGAAVSIQQDLPVGGGENKLNKVNFSSVIKKALDDEVMIVDIAESEDSDTDSFSVAPPDLEAWWDFQYVPFDIITFFIRCSILYFNFVSGSQRTRLLRYALHADPSIALRHSASPDMVCSPVKKIFIN